jgi:pyrroline-5-carboxylate reductase
MTKIKVGILGVGHLTYHMVPGLLAGATGLDIALSARNAELAAKLEARHGVQISKDNADLVENSDVVLVAVRQFDALDVVHGLPWHAGQTVISCCAGLGLEAIARLTGAATLVRAMPTIAAEFGASPTCIYPDNAVATAVLSNCGTVIALESEQHFNAATVTVCYSSMLFGLLARMVEWNEAKGLAPATARRLVSELTGSTAAMAAQRDHLTLEEIVEELATPGSFTLRGLEALRSRDAFRPWVDMSDALIEELTD